jgi:ABC-type dipeptide/oligopeptide/nickel transport system permease subunit
VSEYRFLNQMQPQTLWIATVFCYIDAAFGILGFAFLSLLGLLLVVGLGLGGFGIANEKKWGYAIAVAAAILQVAFVLTAGTDAFKFPLILNLVFDGALVALLLHPASREYQRIWFK